MDAMLRLAAEMLEGYGVAKALFAENSTNLKRVSEQILPLMDRIVSEQATLRAVLLGKMDGFQGTMELVREDTRNAWGTADFAIVNSRDAREESDKLVSLISVMQRQQQRLASQVGDLRRKAAENERP